MVYLYQNPVDLIRHIQEMQHIVAQEIAWITSVYGLAKLETKEFDGRTVSYPRVYAGNEEHYDVSPNTEEAGSSFFYINQPLEKVEGRYYRTILNLIVSANLKLVKGIDSTLFDSVHSLLNQVSKLNLNGNNGLRVSQNARKIEITSIYFNQLSTVFPDFNFWNEQERRFRTYPMTCFRIQYDFSYHNDC